MKIYYIICLVLLAFCISVFPQKRYGRGEEMRERMAELEKIKLIEVLEMDEETTLRFFSRRTDFKKQHDNLREQLDEKIDLLETTLKSARMVTDEELKSMIDDIGEINLKLEKQRIQHIKSLNDLLTYDQIGRYIVFERRFREELRRLILHERKPNLQD